MNIDNIILFATHHWLLVTIFIVLATALIWVETQGKVGGVSRLNPQQAIHLINRENAAIFDLRDKGQFEKGHIANAISLNATELDSKSFDKYKEQPVILICGAGANAAKYGTQLKQHNMTKLHFLQGGIEAWKQANLPLVKKRAKKAKK